MLSSCMDPAKVQRRTRQQCRSLSKYLILFGSWNGHGRQGQEDPSTSLVGKCKDSSWKRDFISIGRWQTSASHDFAMWLLVSLGLEASMVFIAQTVYDGMHGVSRP